eukprot:1153026-Pelagomonas_calceolata.AAC.1
MELDIRLRNTIFKCTSSWRSRLLLWHGGNLSYIGLGKGGTLAQEPTQSPNRKGKTLLHVEAELQTPTINPLASNWLGNDAWRYKENLVKKLAQEATANHAINVVYYNDINITHIDAWRIY